ncbi:hypothetical protein FBR05_09600 [Deltaproteobacteria bacterium PRO3]|nr:hypothetical protein [Deltaproteobacteria bacterium PRO3]
MGKLLIGLVAACGLLFASAAGHATIRKNVDEVCYAECLKIEQADQCNLGSVRVCAARCTISEDTRAFFNGVEVFGGMTKDDRGIEYYASPLVNACTQCDMDRGQIDPNNQFTCAVAPASTSNLCTELDPTFQATSIVNLVPNSTFAESIRIGKILWNIDLIQPCFPVIDVGNQTLTNGTISCNTGTQVGGLGCKERKRSETSFFCPTSNPTAIGCNTLETTKCVSSSADSCADGNQVGVY